jgi:L-asparaginase
MTGVDHGDAVNRRRRLILITTGGTISTTRDRVGLLEPTRDAQDLAAVIRGSGQVDIEPDEYARVLSSQLTVEDVFGIARHVRDRLADPSIDGIVVTHGTSTLEETAFATGLLSPDDRPIVFTGAMYGHDDGPWADGPGNLSDAVRVASSPAARGLGALVVFAGRIFLSDDVAKTHTTRLDAFTGPDYGPIGFVYPDQIEIGRYPVRRHRVPDGELETKVDLIKFAVGMPARQIVDAVEGGAAGIVLEAAGLGNVNRPVADALRQAVQAGIRVVVATRVWSGRVYPTYASPAAAAGLLDAGCVLTSLPGTKARLLLMLSTHLAGDDLARRFDSPVAAAAAV